MRLEVHALAGRIGGEQDAQGVLHRVSIEPTLDFLAPGAAREAIDDLDALFGTFAALNRLLENHLQVALRALAILGEDEDAAIVPFRRISLRRLSKRRQVRTEIPANPVDQVIGLSVGLMP